MTQPQPIQKQPSLPAFLNTSRETQQRMRLDLGDHNPSPPPRGLLGAIAALQITSGLTLGLVLGQLAITIGILTHQPAPQPQPTPPSLQSF